MNKVRKNTKSIRQKYCTFEEGQCKRKPTRRKAKLTAKGSCAIYRAASSNVWKLTTKKNEMRSEKGGNYTKSAPALEFNRPIMVVTKMKYTHKADCWTKGTK